jgi:hypothetical protein
MRTSATDISTSSAKPAPAKLDRYLDFHFFTNEADGNMMMFMSLCVRMKAWTKLRAVDFPGPQAPIR